MKLTVRLMSPVISMSIRWGDCEAMRRLSNLVDALIGWGVRSFGGVNVGRDASVVWRRFRKVAGNRLSIGENSILHAYFRFEDRGGEIRIGNRTYIGRSDLVCHR